MTSRCGHGFLGGSHAIRSNPPEGASPQDGLPRKQSYVMTWRLVYLCACMFNYMHTLIHDSAGERADSEICPLDVDHVLQIEYVG